MTGFDTETADAKISVNHEAFVELVDLAEQLERRRRPSEAAAAAAAAAGSAWMRHAGIHASPASNASFDRSRVRVRLAPATATDR